VQTIVEDLKLETALLKNSHLIIWSKIGRLGTTASWVGSGNEQSKCSLWES